MSGHRQYQSGQLSYMAMIGMIPLAILIAMVFNVGALVVKKEQAQSAADAAALAQATLSARSLNVIAANNVAITQTFSIDVIASALMPSLIEATVNAAREVEQIVKVFESCKPTLGYGCLLGSVRSYNYYKDIATPLAAIWRDFGVNVNWLTLPVSLLDFRNLDGTAKMEEFAVIAEALAEMNDEIVKSFPAVSRAVQEELGRANGLEEPPAFFAGFMKDPRMRNLEYRSTELPVRKIEFDFNGVAQTLLGEAPIQRTGERGSPTTMPRETWNFQAHGYPIGRGPYEIGWRTAQGAINPPVQALARRVTYWTFRICFFGCWNVRIPIGPGPNLPGDIKFQETRQWCWQIAAPTQIAPGGNCYTPFKARQLTLYQFDMDVLEAEAHRYGLSALLGTSDPDKWSIVAFTAGSRRHGPVAGNYLPAQPSSAFGYAQAQIFNDVYPDLYTQAWRAALVPSTLLSGERRPSVQSALNGMPEFRDLYNALNAAEVKDINAH